MTGRSLVIHLARGVGLPTAVIFQMGNEKSFAEFINWRVFSIDIDLPKHSSIKPVPTGTLIVCENDAILAGARVFVTCVTSDVGSPSPTDVDAVTQKSYFWFSTRLRASKVTGYPCSSTRTILPNWKS